MSKKTLAPLKWYQYISKFTPASCRYYPTCSEYAKWLYENSNFTTATAKSAIRILRCNQLFEGGIDYPKINYTPPSIISIKNRKIKVKYWLIFNGKNYTLIKDFNAINA